MLPDGSILVISLNELANDRPPKGNHPEGQLWAQVKTATQSGVRLPGMGLIEGSEDLYRTLANAQSTVGVRLPVARPGGVVVEGAAEQEPLYSAFMILAYHSSAADVGDGESRAPVEHRQPGDREVGVDGRLVGAVPVEQQRR